MRKSLIKRIVPLLAFIIWSSLYMLFLLFWNLLQLNYSIICNKCRRYQCHLWIIPIEYLYIVCFWILWSLNQRYVAYKTHEKPTHVVLLLAFVGGQVHAIHPLPRTEEFFRFSERFIECYDQILTALNITNFTYRNIELNVSWINV